MQTLVRQLDAFSSTGKGETLSLGAKGLEERLCILTKSEKFKRILKAKHKRAA